MDMERCILCNKSLTGLETVTVKKKGVENIKKCSIKRNDGLIELMLKKEELLVHVSCRKAYINENMIKSHLKKKELDSLFSYVHVDSQEESLEFDFNLKCIFCNQDAKEDNSNKDRVRTIKMAKTVHSIKNYALKRGDSVSETILSGDSLREVGKISHGWDRELVSFTTLVQLPDTAALPKHKALVLAAAFLLEYTYFEKSKRSCGLCC